jgi:hypothetical protein
MGARRKHEARNCGQCLHFRQFLNVFRQDGDSGVFGQSPIRSNEEQEEHPLQRHGQQDPFPLLTSERIHCATRLCNELAAELESHNGSFKTQGIAEFNRAIDRMRECLERSVLPSETDARDKGRFPRE